MVLAVVHEPLASICTVMSTLLPARDAGIRAPLRRTVLPSATEASATLSVTLALTKVMTLRLVTLVPLPPGVVTVIGPEVAPAGTRAVIRVSEITVNTVAGVRSKATARAPEKPVPVTVTRSPTAADAGRKPATVGAGGRGGVWWGLPAGSVSDAVRG